MSQRNQTLKAHSRNKAALSKFTSRKPRNLKLETSADDELEVFATPPKPLMPKTMKNVNNTTMDESCSVGDQKLPAL